MSTRHFLGTGDLPSTIKAHGRFSNQDQLFERALCHAPGSLFKEIYDLFSRDALTDKGSGSYYLHAIIGNVYSGGLETIYAVAGHNAIPILDLTTITNKALKTLTIRELGQYILETPPRCAIILSLLDTATNARLAKVVVWLSRQQLDLRFRRLIFCLVADSTQATSGMQIHRFPGSIDDKVQMLLYKLPIAFTGDSSRLRPVADAMSDYAVFQPNIWRCVDSDPGTPTDAFLSTLMFQVHRRMSLQLDTSLDNYPSFETEWRRSLCDDLQKNLNPTPDSTCQGIHRVLPAGVSRGDAMRCIQTALPRNLTDPYALTVASDAVDDRCGTIAITQRTHHILVHLQCSVDPRIMSQVCGELRTGHRLIVQEMDTRFKSLQGEIEILKDLIVSGIKRTPDSDTRQCAKKSCSRAVSDRFSDGRRKKQCVACIESGNKSRIKQ
jgi:hypothetical protein